ncbi:unnamed protein product [Vitrella brassicaformis CCMP3155]|uniref:Uncharacterized protein n=2 Tax=Vitrella brassicaformis TaxID=1169539 RepID=A0A0G4E9X3_VITBC|nr:unnamed protein product [Vitrella brassicaformis CCMP3155]|eukprot:CEL92245.1 unnamed protein product [Vitrella brassicaformis CCMP3155]
MVPLRSAWPLGMSTSAPPRPQIMTGGSEKCITMPCHASVAFAAAAASHFGHPHRAFAPVATRPSPMNPRATLPRPPPPSPPPPPPPPAVVHVTPPAQHDPDQGCPTSVTQIYATRVSRHVSGPSQPSAPAAQTSSMSVDCERTKKDKDDGRGLGVSEISTSMRGSDRSSAPPPYVSLEGAGSGPHGVLGGGDEAGLPSRDVEDLMERLRGQGRVVWTEELVGHLERLFESVRCLETACVEEMKGRQKAQTEVENLTRSVTHLIEENQQIRFLYTNLYDQFQSMGGILSNLSSNNNNNSNNTSSPSHQQQDVPRQQELDHGHDHDDGEHPGGRGFQWSRISRDTLPAPDNPIPAMPDIHVITEAAVEEETHEMAHRPPQQEPPITDANKTPVVPVGRAMPEPDTNEGEGEEQGEGEGAPGGKEMGGETDMDSGVRAAVQVLQSARQGLVWVRDKDVKALGDTQDPPFPLCLLIQAICLLLNSQMKGRRARLPRMQLTDTPFHARHVWLMPWVRAWRHMMQARTSPFSDTLLAVNAQWRDLPICATRLGRWAQAVVNYRLSTTGGRGPPAPPPTLSAAAAVAPVPSAGGPLLTDRPTSRARRPPPLPHTKDTAARGVGVPLSAR